MIQQQEAWPPHENTFYGEDTHDELSITSRFGCAIAWKHGSKGNFAISKTVHQWCINVMHNNKIFYLNQQ